MLFNRNPIGFTGQVTRFAIGEANEEAHMGRKAIIAVIIGAMLGTVIGYGIVQSLLGVALGAVIGAGIVAVGLWLIALEPFQVWMTLGEFSQITECCCSFIGVLSLASIGTLGAFLLWHSLALAALAGVSVLTAWLIVLSAWARSYKDASAVQ